MAPRRVLLLLLLVSGAAACSGLLASSSSSSPAVVRAARDQPPHRADADVPAAETTTAGFQPPTVVDADGGALGGVLPHLIHPRVLTDDATDDTAVQRTVYDVTVVFRATARLGPPRLQYYVVPADASVPISGGADDSIKARADGGMIPLFVGLLMGSILGSMGVCILVCILGVVDNESSRDSATPRNPEVVLGQAAAAGAAKARRGY